MKSIFVDSLPLLLFSSAKDLANAKRISRLAKVGQIRKIYRGIYTSDLETPLERIVRPNWRVIVEHLCPSGVMAYRSANLLKPDELGNIYLVQGNRVKHIKLPGLHLHILPGHPALLNDSAGVNDITYGKLFIASEVRMLLENLYTGKGANQSALGIVWVESYLTKICAIRGEFKLNALRDDAKKIASLLGFDKQYMRLNKIVSALMQTGNARMLRASSALARAAGKPYDSDRIELFDHLASALKIPFPAIAEPARTNAAITNFAFFEAYFSNYIEGTTFTLEEASAIIFDGKMIPTRDADSHDVLGTFQAVVEEPFRSKVPRDENEFLEWLQRCNFRILSSRPEKLPGQWKEQLNQAGNSIFVHPELVKGTLSEGFKRIEILEDPFAKAMMAMFIVSEVHPFLDGNGRTARLLMNAYLSASQACRIIIPTNFREDYLLLLKALSQQRNPAPFIKAMLRAWRWSTKFDYQNFEKLCLQMKTCNAFSNSASHEKLLDPENI